METITMFEQASRLKFRFDSPLGGLCVEDLWDLPLTTTARSRTPVSLDALAIGLAKQVRDLAEVTSFVAPAAMDAGKDELQLKFDIVKHVIEVRIAERDAKQAEVDRREKKQRILALIAEKQDKALSEQSVEELMALANSL